jgi:hypothetical protein
VSGKEVKPAGSSIGLSVQHAPLATNPRESKEGRR